MRGLNTIELAYLKEKNILADFLLSGSVLLSFIFSPLGALLVMKTLEDEWYIVTIAYNIFELSHIAYLSHPYI